MNQREKSGGYNSDDFDQFIPCKKCGYDIEEITYEYTGGLCEECFLNS